MLAFERSYSKLIEIHDSYIYIMNCKFNSYLFFWNSSSFFNVKYDNTLRVPYIRQTNKRGSGTNKIIFTMARFAFNNIKGLLRTQEMPSLINRRGGNLLVSSVCCSCQIFNDHNNFQYLYICLTVPQFLQRLLLLDKFQKSIWDWQNHDMKNY